VRSEPNAPQLDGGREQLTHGDPQSARDGLEVAHARLGLAALDGAVAAARQARGLGDPVLREAFGAADSPEVRGDVVGAQGALSIKLAISAKTVKMDSSPGGSGCTPSAR
jgi:hypothetical protein